MARVRFGDVVKEIKINIDRATDNHEFYIAGEHMETENIHLTKRGRFEGSDVGPAFIRLFRPGQILYGSRRTYLKKVAVADFEGITSNTTFVLETKDQNVMMQELLPFIMLTDSFTEYAIRNSKGSTNPYILFSDLCAYEFELPAIEEQRILTKRLLACDNVKEAYKHLIASTDELVKSQFVEMFGDMESNPKKWRESTVGQECYYIKDGPHKSPPYVEEGIPFISTRNVVNGDGIDWSTAKYISEADYLECIKKCKPEKGNILYSKGGTTGIAKLIETDKRFANWVHVAVLKFGEQLNGKFFECMLNMDYCYQQSQRLTKGIANRDFVLSAIAQVKIFVPPIGLQKQYEEFVRQADKSKYVARQATSNLRTYGIL